MRILLYIVSLFSFGFTFAPVKDQKLKQDFPVPVKTKNMLYYLQRTTNINTLVYELNFDKDSVLNSKEPIHVYWIRYAEGGAKAELSYIQKHYAYGLETIPLSNENYKFRFVSYKKLDFYLLKSSTDHQYHAYISLKNKLFLLDRIFVNVVGGSFWFPEITFIEIKCKDPETGENIVKKIIP